MRGLYFLGLRHYIGSTPMNSRCFLSQSSQKREGGNLFPRLQSQGRTGGRLFNILNKIHMVDCLTISYIRLPYFLNLLYIVFNKNYYKVGPIQISQIYTIGSHEVVDVHLTIIGATNELVAIQYNDLISSIKDTYIATINGEIDSSLKEELLYMVNFPDQN